MRVCICNKCTYIPGTSEARWNGPVQERVWVSCGFRSSSEPPDAH